MRHKESKGKAGRYSRGVASEECRGEVCILSYVGEWSGEGESNHGG